MHHLVCPECGIGINGRVARSEHCPRCWRRHGRRVAMKQRPPSLHTTLDTEVATVRKQMQNLTPTSRTT